MRVRGRVGGRAGRTRVVVAVAESRGRRWSLYTAVRVWKSSRRSSPTFAEWTGARSGQRWLATTGAGHLSCSTSDLGL